MNMDDNREKINIILELLREQYPQSNTSLKYRTPFELFVAAVLSAQTTDKQVNRVTKRLFIKYNTPWRIAGAKPEELEILLRGCGIFRSKTRYLIGASKIIATKFNGKVPENFEDLISLPGVGRKTANVILSSAFNKPAFAVDTHVYRVSHRLGIAKQKSFRGTEEDLCKLIPAEKWSGTHHRLIAHGRKICHARNPRCPECFLFPYCSNPGKET